MCHRARFFVLVTFLNNPEKKNKDYNKCCFPFQPFFCLCTPYVYHWAETWLLLIKHWQMGVENDKKDFDLAYVTQHITLWFSLKHGYSMSWYFDAFLHVGFM